ncbi:hypothetical protein [Photobacterium damselae]|uniref:hypothetical protein n=1 Tax=Photobacterium damselae TaxID=38293 RepID=UPI004068AB33
MYQSTIATVPVEFTFLDVLIMIESFQSYLECNGNNKNSVNFSSETLDATMLAQADINQIIPQLFKGEKSAVIKCDLDHIDIYDAVLESIEDDLEPYQITMALNKVFNTYPALYFDSCIDYEFTGSEIKLAFDALSEKVNSQREYLLEH